MKFFALLPLLLISCVLNSCGRVIEDSEADSAPTRGGATPRDPGTILNPGEYIRAQQLTCEDVLFCPENIAKLVIIHEGKATNCVGTLIEQDKILTSASCLPKSLRVPYLKCSNSIYSVFAPSGFNAPGEIVGCKDIEYVNNNLFKEPALWQSDFAIIRLNKKVNRNVAFLSNSGVEEGGSLSTWKIHHETQNLGVIKETKCISSMNTYLNPFSDNAFSSMFVSSNCDLNSADTGAPMYRGTHLVGIFSQEMSRKIYDQLAGSKIIIEGSELGRYYHVNNISCAEFSENYIGVLGPDACFKNKTVAQLDHKRSSMLKNIEVHYEQMDRVEEELETPEKYFVWDVKFQYNGRLKSVEPHFGKPKCIYKSKKWIGEYRRWRKIKTFARIKVETPNYTLHTKLTKDLRPISVVKNDGIKTYFVEFNPFNAYVNKKTSVTIISKIKVGDKEEEVAVTYPEVKANCP